MNIKKQFREGLITNNPVLVQQIGMCATMAITTSLFNGVGMGLSVLIILTCCNVVVAAIRKIIPNEIRLAIFVVVIAGFVSVVQMLMQAYLPDLYDMLGVYLALIVVNCIILGRAEMFARKNGVVDSALDGLGMGLGFTIALILMATFREVVGAGTFAGIEIPLLKTYNIPILVASPGGFFAFGCIIALVAKLTNKPKEKMGCAGCPSAEACGKLGCTKEEKEENVNA